MNFIKKILALFFAFLLTGQAVFANSADVIHEGFTRKALTNSVMIEDGETGHKAGAGATVELKIPDNNFILKKEIDNPTPEVSQEVTIKIIVGNLSDVIGIPKVKFVEDFDENHFEYVDGSLQVEPIGQHVVNPFGICTADAVQILCEADEFPVMNGEILITYKLKPLRKGSSIVTTTLTDAHENEEVNDLTIIVDDPKNYYTLTKNVDNPNAEVGDEIILTTTFMNRHPYKDLEDVWYFDDYDSELLELIEVKGNGVDNFGKQVSPQCQSDGNEIRCHLEKMHPWETRTVIAKFVAIKPGRAIATSQVHDEDNTEDLPVQEGAESSFQIPNLFTSLFGADEEAENAAPTETGAGDGEGGGASTESFFVQAVSNLNGSGEDLTNPARNYSLARQDATIIIRDPGNQILVTKDVNKGSVEAGERIQMYTTIKNRTGTEIRDIRLTDVYSGDLLEIVDLSSPSDFNCQQDSAQIRCHIERLRPGITHSYKVTFRAKKDGVATSTTSVAKQETFEGETMPDDVTATVSIMGTGNPFLVRKTPNKRTVEVGEELMYTITIKNRSSAEILRNVRVFDDFPEDLLQYEELIINRKGEGLNCSGDAASVVCDIEQLAPGEVHTIVTRFTTLKAGRAINTVTVADEKGLILTVSDGGSGSGESAGAEDDDTRNEDLHKDDNVTFVDESGLNQNINNQAASKGIQFAVDSGRISSADAHVIIKDPNNPLYLTKRVENTEVDEGETVRFLITVKNKSKQQTLEEIILEDTYPIDLLRVDTWSIPSECTVSAGYIKCDVGTLKPEEEYTIIPEFTALARVTAPEIGTETKTEEEKDADAEGGDAESVSKSFIATNTVKVNDGVGGHEDAATADVIIKNTNNPFHLTKNASKVEFEPGERVQFTIILQNTADFEANFSNIFLTDTYPTEYLELDETSVPNCVVSAGEFTCDVGTLVHRGYGVLPNNESYYKISPIFTVKRPSDAPEGPITIENGVEANDGADGHSDIAKSRIIIKDPGNPYVLQKNPNNGVVEVGEKVQFVAFLRNRDKGRTMERIEIFDDFDEEFLRLSQLETEITHDDEEINTGGHTCKADVGGIRCDLDELPANSTLTIIAEYEALKPGRATNTITMKDRAGYEDTASSEVIIADPGRPFVLTKFPHDGRTPPQPKTTVQVGEEIYFDISIKNIRDFETLENVTITDTIPYENLELVDVLCDAEIQCAPDAKEIVCNIPEISPGEKQDITMIYKAIAPGEVANVVVADTSDSCTLCEADNEDCCKAEARSNIIIPTPNNPFILTKTPSNSTVQVGEEVEYTIVFKNRDPVQTMERIKLIDDFPEENLEIISVETKPLTANCSADATEIDCYLDTLEAGEEFMIISKYKAIRSGTATNTVQVYDEFDFGAETGDQMAAEESTILIKDPNNPLFVSKSVSRTDIDIGDQVEFTVRVQNRHGHKKFEEITLVDTYPTDLLQLDTGSVPANCSVSAGEITCNIQNLYTQPQNQANEILPNVFEMNLIFRALAKLDTATETAETNEDGETVTTTIVGMQEAINSVTVDDGIGGHSNSASAKVIIHDPNDPTDPGSGSGTTGNNNGNDGASNNITGENGNTGTLVLKKVANRPEITVGEKVTFTLTLRNSDSDRVFNNITLTDSYPSDALRLVPESLPEECGADASSVICSVGTLSTESQANNDLTKKSAYTVDIEFIALEKEGDDSYIAQNTAQASDDAGRTSNKPSPEVIIKKGENPLLLTKKTNKTIVEIGEEVVFTLTLKNKDDNRVFDGVTLTDTFPNEYLEVIPDSLPEECSVSAEKITCDVGTLRPKEILECAQVVRYAKKINSEENECVALPNSCYEIPDGWEQTNEFCDKDAPEIWEVNEKEYPYVINPRFIATKKEVMSTEEESDEETEKTTEGSSMASYLIENKSEAVDMEGHRDYSAVKIYVKDPNHPFTLTKGVAGNKTNFRVGEVVSFNVRVENNYSDRPLRDVEILDTYPSDLLELKPETLPEYCSADATKISCVIPKVPSKSEAIEDDEIENFVNIRLDFIAIKKDENAQIAKNEVFAKDKNGHENMADAEVIIKAPNNPLYLTKSLTETTTVEVGQNITYDLTVQNLDKNQEFVNVILTDNYPRDLLELIPESIEGTGCTFGAGLIECRIEQLLPIGDEDIPAEGSSYTITPEFRALEKKNFDECIEEDGSCTKTTEFIATNTAEVSDGADGHTDMYTIDLIVTPPVVKELELTSDCEGKNIFLTTECRLRVKATYEYADTKIITKDIEYYGHEGYGTITDNIFISEKSGEAKIQALVDDVASNEITLNIVDALGVATDGEGNMVTHFPARVTGNSPDEKNSTIHYGGNIETLGEEGAIEMVAKHNRLIFTAFGGSGNYTWFLEDKKFGNLLDFDEEVYGIPYDDCWDVNGELWCRDPDTGQEGVVVSNCQDSGSGRKCTRSNSVIFESADIEGEVILELFDDEENFQPLTIHVLPAATEKIEIRDAEGNPLSSTTEMPQENILMFSADEFLFNGEKRTSVENEITWEFKYNSEEFAQSVTGLGNILGGVLEPERTGTYVLRAKKTQNIALPGKDGLHYSEEEVFSEDITLLVGDAIPYIDSIRTAGNLGMAQGTTETLYVRLRHFNTLSEIGDIELNLIKGRHTNPNNIPDDVQHFTIDLVEDDIMREMSGKKTSLIEIPFFVPLLQDIQDGIHTFRLTVRNLNGEKGQDVAVGLLPVYIGDPQLGDANINGDLTLADAVLTMKFVEGNKEPDSIQVRTLDSDGQNGITIRDFMEIFRKYLLDSMK